MKNIAEILNKKIISLKSPIVVGLDPVFERIPKYYKEKHAASKNKFESVGNIMLDFGKDIIDAVYDSVPAVKLQIAFYEAYGSSGMLAFEKTVKYAKSKGMIVIEDGKRNDIGNTAKMYAKGHLGKVFVTDEEESSSLDVDFLTVSPYLGEDSMDPFVEECKKNNKGIFILVKTSNSKSRYIQNIADTNGLKVYEVVANYIANRSKTITKTNEYSTIGAVVGATYPFEAKELRKKMKRNIFLVPGYGAQGAKLEDMHNFFNDDGLGAIINSSRAIIYAYEKCCKNLECTANQYIETVKSAVYNMRRDIVKTINNPY